MQTYSYTPKRQNKIPIVWLAVLSAMVVVSVLLCVLFPHRQLIGEIGFVVFAVSDIWIYSRYFFIRYTYTLTLIGGEPALLVTQHRGKQNTVVCQRELSGLSEFHEFHRGEKLPRELRVDTRFRFLVSMSPDVWQTLYFIIDGECASVTLELDEQFVSTLRDALSTLHRSLEGDRVEDVLMDSALDVPTEETTEAPTEETTEDTTAEETV